MKEEILPPNRDVEPVENDNSKKILNIGHFHYHGNDLREFRLLAEASPELAKKVLEQRDNEDARANISFRFGLVVSLLLVAIIVFSFTWLLTKFGLLGTLTSVGAILAVAVLVRVILTGQWSETTWFGKLVGSIARALGATGTD